MPKARVLSYISDHHYVTHDNEHLVLLVWGRITIQLHVGDLTIVTHLLERWTPEASNWATPDGSYGICLDSRGAVQLWIVDTGLRLQPNEFLLLSKLLCTAVRRLSQYRETASRHEGCVRYESHQVPEQMLQAPELQN